LALLLRAPLGLPLRSAHPLFLSIRVRLQVKTPSLAHFPDKKDSCWRIVHTGNSIWAQPKFPEPPMFFEFSLGAPLKNGKIIGAPQNGKIFTENLEIFF